MPTPSSNRMSPRPRLDYSGSPASRGRRHEPPLTKFRAALADRYTIERELGRGGMATVYLARDIKQPTGRDQSAANGTRRGAGDRSVPPRDRAEVEEAQS